MRVTLQDQWQVLNEEGGIEQLPCAGWLRLSGELGHFVRDFCRHFWREKKKKEGLRASELQSTENFAFIFLLFL